MTSTKTTKFKHVSEVFKTNKNDVRDPIVGLGFVDVVDVVDEHNLKATDISRTILKRFLLQNYFMMIFEN